MTLPLSGVRSIFMKSPKKMAMMVKRKVEGVTSGRRVWKRTIILRYSPRSCLYLPGKFTSRSLSALTKMFVIKSFVLVRFHLEGYFEICLESKHMSLLQSFYFQQHSDTCFHDSLLACFVIHAQKYVKEPYFTRGGFLTVEGFVYSANLLLHLLNSVIRESNDA